MIVCSADIDIGFSVPYFSVGECQKANHPTHKVFSLIAMCDDHSILTEAFGPNLSITAHTTRYGPMTHTLKAN